MTKSIWWHWETAIFFAFLITISIVSCTRTPKAEAPPVVEQDKHVIRYLAYQYPGITGNEPAVWLIEVDGKQFVAVDGCGVSRKDE